MSDKKPNPISDPVRAGQTEDIWELFSAQKAVSAPPTPAVSVSNETEVVEKSDRKPAPEEDTWFLVFGISLGIGLWSLDVGTSRVTALPRGTAAMLASAGSGPSQQLESGGRG